MNAPPPIQYADLVDLDKLQALMQSFHRVIGIANAVIDTNGVVLAQAGWQRACQDFHRKNPETCSRCIASDTALAQRMTRGEPYAVYNCLNGLVDTAAPIIVDGVHVANVFTGQFLTQPPDMEAFRQRAKAAGFDEVHYLSAIAEVPVVPVERVEAVTSLYAQLASMLADNGMDRLRQQQSADHLRRLNAELETRIAARTEELAKSEQRLRASIEASPVPTAMFTLSQRVTYLNAAFVRTFGYTLEDVPTLDAWWGRAYPDPAYRAQVRQTWEARLAESDRLQHPFQPMRVNITCKDGSVRVIEGEAAVVGEDSKLLRLVVFHDITELLKATEAQTRSESKLRALYESSTDAIMLLDGDNFLDCNGATLSVFGLPSKEAFCRLHPEDLSAPAQPGGGDPQALSRQYIDEAFTKGSSHFEWTLQRLDDGRHFVADVKLSRLELDGRPMLQGIVRDITEKKRAEWEMASQKALLQTILDKSPVSVGISVNDTMRFVNRKCAETFGIQSGDDARQLFVDLQARSAILDVLAREGIAQNREIRMYDKQRQVRDMRATYMPITYEGETGVLSWIEDITEQKASARLIAQQQEATQKLIDSSPVGMAFTTNGVFSYANPAFRAMFDIAPGDQAEAIYLRPEDRAGLMERIRRDGVVSGCEMRLRGAGGAERDMLMTYVPFVHGGAEGLMGWAIDISERKQAERAISESKERLEAAASAGIVGVWDWDIVSNKLVWDKVMYRLYGINEQDFSGAYEAWSATVHPDDRPRLEQEIQAALRGERDYCAEFRVIWPDASLRYLKAVSHTSFDAHGRPLRMVGVNYDLTEQKTIQQQLDQMAYYDRLTSLPNRRLLEDRMEQAIGRAQREARRLALLFIDLDKFKQVNDVHGHDAGDWLLRDVASRLLSCLRGSDTAARIGGDEFIVLLPNADLVTDALQVAERIRQALERPFVMPNGTVLDISSSIGVAIYPDHADNARDLLKYGDEAMYDAKRGGRNAVVLFAGAQQVPGLVAIKGDSLVRLRWTTAFASGNPSIDEEHQELLSQANSLLNLAAHVETSPQAFNAAFGAFVAFLSKHFADEEALLASLGYRGQAEHAAQHHALVSRAIALREASEAGSLSVSALIEFLVTEVVSRHLLSEDKKFFDLFR
ncbi:PocR ligand-binding domain-containing protein [Massilia sp. TS11]|uniref:PocR ligand-binding domain-containing protein n=1 Tax=Massilia sp. TS11 TaxID=2908003 RepID=UPI001EDA93B4|nr:diguanylate cyclase [Massilia sp. TS11]MCG2583643.1 diguanylate cyclase [Massilia sp. TS11]